MTWASPLQHFQKISTNRVEEAEAEISRMLSDIKILRVADRKRFQLTMNEVNIGNTSLVFNQFGVETKLDSTLHGDPIIFVFGGRAPTKFDLDNGSVVVSAKRAALVSQGNKGRVERSEGSGILALRTTLPKLIHHFEILTGRYHRGSLIFDCDIDLTDGPGAMMHRMIEYLVYELYHNKQILKNPVLLKSYDEMLMTALLSLPHNHREKLFVDRHKRAAPGIVHRAEEYMRAHLHEVISISDLIRICGCSQSILFSTFRSTRGYTPMEFLTEQRLQSVREKLLKPHPEASVTSIALDCGFTHLGRFSQVYRSRFGERPSDTFQKNG